MNKKKYILPLLMLSTNAFAFPVAESISLYSIFSYWIFSILFGSQLMIDEKRKLNIYRAICLILTIVFVLTLYLIQNNKKLEMNYAVNSISFNYNYLNSQKIDIPFKEQEKTIEYIKSIKKRTGKSLFQDLEDFFKSNEAANFIYLHDNQEIKTAKPTYKTIYTYKAGEENELIEFVKKSNINSLKIYASDPMNAGYISYKIFKETNLIIPVVLSSPKTMSMFRSNAAAKDPEILERIKNRTVTKRSWEEEGLIDISTYFEIMERHSVIQAEIFPVENFFQMTDQEVVEFMIKNENKKFISQNITNLVLFERRLSLINQNWKFINYFYIPTFYENNDEGYPVTPYFFNNGKIWETDELRNELIKTEDVRILCFDYEKCALKIPTERFDVINPNPFESNLLKELNKLDKNKNYVAVVDNRYEYGWAYKIGYLMNINKDMPSFLGFYYLPQRLDYYEWLKTNIYTENDFKGTSLAEKQKNLLEELLSINQTNKESLFVKFLILGLIFKAILFLSTGLMLLSKKKVWHTVYSLISVAALIYMVLTISGLLMRYPIVPFDWYIKISQADQLKVFITFILILSISTWIKSKSIKVASIVLLILGLMFVTDFIFTINMFVACLIIGFEIGNIIIESLLLVYQKNKNKYIKIGVYSSHNALDDTPFPEKWLLVNKFNNSNGYLVDINNRKTKEQNKFLQNKFKNKKIIIRSCASESVEQNLAGFFDSKIIDKVKGDEINLVINELKGKMDFVWIQEYVQAEYYGVAKSYDNSLMKIFISYGDASAATEGTKNMKEISIERLGKIENQMFDDIRKKILKIEKFYKSPVIIEFAYKNKNVVINQIRLDKEEANIKAYKFYLPDYKLCEGYLTKCSRITGTILEKITNNDFIWINGFLYEKKMKSKKLVNVQKTILKSSKDMDLIEEYLEKEIMPMAALMKIKDLLKIYKNIYDASQSSWNRKGVNIKTKSYELSEKEIDVADNMPSIKENRGDMINMSQLDVREQIRLLNRRVVFLLNNAIKKFTNKNDQEFRNDHIDDYFNEYKNTTNFYYDEKSLFDVKDETIIVPGEISGKYWLCNNEMNLPPKDGQKYILVGEEIGSSWVRHLDCFEGLLSVYGNNLTHLAISAKEMKKPYRKISLDDLQKIKTQL